MLYIFWFHLGRKWMKRRLELCKAATCHVASGVQAGIDQKNLKGLKGGRCKTCLICQDRCQPTNSIQFILHFFANILEYLGIRMSPHPLTTKSTYKNCGGVVPPILERKWALDFPLTLKSTKTSNSILGQETNGFGHIVLPTQTG